MSINKFPVLDFSKYHYDLENFSNEVLTASKEWGFFILTNHGVVDLERMLQLSSEFFDLPLEEKAQKLMNEEAIGYDGKNLTTFAASEGMSFGTPPGGILSTENLPPWWDLAKRQEVEDFKSSCHELSVAVMKCFGIGLNLGENHFLQCHEHKDPGNTLKLIKYPRMAKRPSDRVPRLSEHTDWGSISFVFTKQAGLEIRDPQNTWYKVPSIPGGVVVNIADALSLWTGKTLKSTMHRITWENLPIDRDRFSIAYFTIPNHDAELKAPQNDSDQDGKPPLTYRDYYHVRLRLTWGSINGERYEGKPFEDVDASMLERVRRLAVANSGRLESHAV